MQTRAHSIAMVAMLGALGFGVAACSSDGPTATRIELTSDRSLILTAPGESARVSAVAVDANGGEVEGAAVRWRSSDPSAVSVTSDGEVVARTSLGSALLIAEYEELQQLATAVVVALQPRTIIVPTEALVSVSDDRTVVTLDRTAALESLSPGDIIVNGSDNGFLSRVVTVEAQANVLRVDVAEATVPEAVRAMDLRVAPPLVRFQDDLDSNGVETKSSATARTAALSVTFECRLETTLVNVDFDGFNVTPRFDLQHEVVYRVQDGSVEEFGLTMVGELQVDAALGALTLTGGVKGKITCDAKLNPIPFLAVPVFGPIAIGATATPTFGAELEAQYAAATLTVDGLSFTRGERVRTGFGYERTRGYFLIGEQVTTADEAEIARASRAQEDTMSAKIEPFVGVDFGVGVLVGPAVVGTVDILTSKLIGGFELMMDTPLDYRNPAYTGPRWTVFAGANADVNSLLDGINVLGRGLRRLDLDGLDSLVGVDAKLFEVITPLGESPEVVVTASPENVAVGDVVDISVSAPRAEVGSGVESWGFRSGMGMALDDDRLDSQQTATLQWMPTEDDEGSHMVAALVFDDIFGQVDLPYAAANKARVDVGCEGAACMPDPDPGTSGSCFVEEGGRRVIRDGATYSFERVVTVESPSASSVNRTTVTGVFGCHFFPSSNDCVEGWLQTSVVAISGTNASGEPFSSERQTEDLAGLPPPVPLEFCAPGGGLNDDGSGFAVTTRDTGTSTEETRYSFSGCLSTVSPGGSVAPVSSIACCGDAICLSP